MKKLTSMLLVLALLIMQVPASFAAEISFTDVKDGAWFSEPVAWAVENEITTGTSETTFSPNDNCTRAQIVTFLWRAAGQPDLTGDENPFTDVKESDYFYKAVLWAVENSITTGVTATEFGPKNICTREQAVTFMYRAKGQPKPLISTNPFLDVKSTSFSYNPILWAVGYGITNGAAPSKFEPSASCTRAQIVTFLYREETITPPEKFYLVRFYPNNGSAVPEQEVGEGLTVSVPADPTRPGYTFAGWYRNGALTTPYDFSKPVTGWITLYAKWDKIETAYDYLVKKIQAEGEYSISQSSGSGIYDLILYEKETSSSYTVAYLEYAVNTHYITAYTGVITSSGKIYASSMEIIDDKPQFYDTEFEYESDSGAYYYGSSRITSASYTSSTALTFDMYRGSSGVSKSTMEKQHTANMKLIMNGLKDTGLAGSKYTIADLGFTTYR